MSVQQYYAYLLITLSYQCNPCSNTFQNQYQSYKIDILQDPLYKGVHYRHTVNVLFQDPVTEERHWPEFKELASRVR